MKNNILKYFKSSSLEKPNAVAVCYEANQLTYEELTKDAFYLSRKMGDVRLTPVVILLPKSNEAIISILATLMSGNIYVPVDINTPIDRLEQILKSLGSSIIVYNQVTAKLAEKLIKKCCDASLLELESNLERLELSTQIIWDRVSSQVSSIIDTDPAYIIFTSGSTGTPKGVTISHKSVIDYIDWANNTYTVNSLDIIGNQAPLYFDNSTLDIYLSFSNAACLHLIKETVFIFPAKLIEYLNDNKITTIFWVPSLLVTIANLHLLEGRPLPHLKNVLFAGEVMPAKQLKYWLQKHPDATYSNLYGPTEITVDCTYFIVPSDWDGNDVPIGIPCENTNILILDEEGREAEKGELCVSGSSLALGYWGDTEKTASAFIQNPLNSNYRELLYRTGDIVCIKDGLIYFIGRKDFQIKHNGYRIELGEVESIVSLMSNVDACVAGYLPEQKVLYLCVVTSVEVDMLNFKRTLIGKLPKYMIPNEIRFFSELPLTANGKVNRLELNKFMQGAINR